jgi:spermidine synthase
LEARQTPFGRLAVYDSHALGKTLVVGESIALTERDGQGYAELLTHPCILSHARPHEVLILGGGDGSVAREVLRHDSIQNVTIVEIDSDIPELCRTHFPTYAQAFADPRCDIVIDDAFRYLAHCDANRWDIIIVDSDRLAVNDLDAFDQIHHVQLGAGLQKALRPDGLAVIPLGWPLKDAEHYLACLREISGVFAYVDRYQMNLPTMVPGGWVVSLAGNAAITRLHELPADIAEQCQHYSTAVHDGLFSLPPWLHKYH